MNLPLTAIVFVIVALFVDLPIPEGSLASKISRMDFIGNAIFIPAITLLVVRLSNALDYLILIFRSGRINLWWKYLSLD